MMTQHETVSGRKNTHLAHIEDLVLENRSAFALDVLRELGESLRDGVAPRLNISVKWDGAPAIVFGPDPVDGRFFVATKGAFAKTPKLAKSHAEINALFHADLALKMHVAFDALQGVSPRAVVQGDVLFTRNELKTEKLGDGRVYYTFQPNTLIYGVKANSPIGYHASLVDLGLVVHTVYDGGLTGTARPITPAEFTGLVQDRRVVIFEPFLQEFPQFTSDEWTQFSLAYTMATRRIALIRADVYTHLTGVLADYVMRFVNNMVRCERRLRPSHVPLDLAAFLGDKEHQELLARKTVAGRRVVMAKFDEMIDTVWELQDNVVALFEAHQSIAELKDAVLTKLGQDPKVATFVRSLTGYRATGPEGFVVESGGQAVKLVNRGEFSRLNFTTPKNWQRS